MNDCKYCLEALREAASRVHGCISNERGSVSRKRGEYLKAYTRLGHRIAIAEGHDRAGRILEKMLDSHETWGLAEADDLEADEPVEYPEEVQALIGEIDAKVEDDDANT